MLTTSAAAVASRSPQPTVERSSRVARPGRAGQPQDRNVRGSVGAALQRHVDRQVRTARRTARDLRARAHGRVEHLGRRTVASLGIDEVDELGVWRGRRRCALGCARAALRRREGEQQHERSARARRHGAISPRACGSSRGARRRRCRASAVSTLRSAMKLVTTSLTFSLKRTLPAAISRSAVTAALLWLATRGEAPWASWRARSAASTMSANLLVTFSRQSSTVMRATNAPLRDGAFGAPKRKSLGLNHKPPGSKEDVSGRRRRLRHSHAGDYDQPPSWILVEPAPAEDQAAGAREVTPDGALRGAPSTRRPSRVRSSRAVAAGGDSWRSRSSSSC